MKVRALFITLLLALPQSAEGQEDFLDRIPNGGHPSLGGRRRGCLVCHVDPQGDGDRNVFGIDYENAPGGGLFPWPELYDLDSDGDGQTNGVELGDPDGTWLPGQVPDRTSDLSSPGDPDDISFDEPPDAGPAEVGPPDAGPSDGDGGPDATSDSPPDSTGTDVADAGATDGGMSPDARDAGGGSGGGSSGCRCAGSEGDREPGARRSMLAMFLGGLLVALRSEAARRAGRK